MIETLLGGVFGGLLRLAPELLKHLDRGGERKHELAMLDRQIELDKMRGEQALALARAEAEEARESFDAQALIEALQGQMRPSGIRWVDGVSSLIRPVLTFYWCVFLYTAALVAQFVVLTAQLDVGGAGDAPWRAILTLWGADEKAIAGSMFAFWFADRALRGRFNRG
ncbi:hypothetical protein [Phenylobacterium sp. SCN 70-31]|uniref:hypothetical protein n=1 Tax=Phenylobacterium sp. SCN 70-31 TaxID=1660129 RepID=UPI00086DA44F|nr:hypothetical protein [Phenylobacterium sp. SCN 70-31]ODT88099.1 MAG: hypothetical protein ABS78_09410 [Phenylobacterium sp. SCN 70-31]